MRGRLTIWMWLLPLVQMMAVSHLEAQFRQVRESSLFTEPQVLTGRFVFDAPDHVEWIYDAGYQATLPEPLKRFISSAVDGSALRQNDDFSVEQTADGITLTPKKSRVKKIFSKIMLRLDARGLAEQVVLWEPTGDVTTITFTDMTQR